jgi:hypothetical protein
MAITSVVVEGIRASSHTAFEIFEQLAVPPEPFLDRYETHFLQRFRSDRSSS